MTHMQSSNPRNHRTLMDGHTLFVSLGTMKKYIYRLFFFHLIFWNYSYMKKKVVLLNFKKVRNHGLFQVDDESDRNSATIPGQNARLNINGDDHFVGGIPPGFNTTPFRDFEIHWSGFFGCIQSVRPSQVLFFFLSSALRIFVKHLLRLYVVVEVPWIHLTFFQEEKRMRDFEKLRRLLLKYYYAYARTVVGEMLCNLGVLGQDECVGV